MVTSPHTGHSAHLLQRARAVRRVRLAIKSEPVVQRLGQLGVGAFMPPLAAELPPPSPCRRPTDGRWRHRSRMATADGSRQKSEPAAIEIAAGLFSEGG